MGGIQEHSEIPVSKKKSGVKLFPALYHHWTTRGLARGLQKTTSTSDSTTGLKSDWDGPEFGTSPFLHLQKKSRSRADMNS